MGGWVGGWVVGGGPLIPIRGYVYTWSKFGDFAKSISLTTLVMSVEEELHFISFSFAQEPKGQGGRGVGARPFAGGQNYTLRTYSPPVSEGILGGTYPRR